MWNLQSYPSAVLNERMWHFRSSKHTLTPPTYFQGVNTPNPQDLLSCVLISIGDARDEQAWWSAVKLCCTSVSGWVSGWVSEWVCGLSVTLQHRPSSVGHCISLSQSRVCAITMCHSLSGFANSWLLIRILKYIELLCNQIHLVAVSFSVGRPICRRC